MVTKDANVDTNTYDNVSQFQVPMDDVFAMKAEKVSQKLSTEIIQKLKESKTYLLTTQTTL